MGTQRQPEWCQTEDIDPRDCPLTFTGAEEESFCSHCGRCNVSAELDVKEGFSVLANKKLHLELPLILHGPEDMAIEVEGQSNEGFSVNRIGPDRVALHGPILANGEERRTFVAIRTTDGVRKPKKLPELRPMGEFRIFHFSLTGVQPKPRFSTEGVLLHPRRRVQSLSLSLPEQPSIRFLRVILEAQGSGYVVRKSNEEITGSQIALHAESDCILQVELKDPAVAAHGAIVIKSLEGEELSRCKVVYVPRERRTRSPRRFTIGIDFGTSGTSVYVLEYGRGMTWQNVTPILDEDGTFSEESLTRRWPSIIFMPTERKSTWKYGLKALNMVESLNSSKEGGFVTRVKSALREENMELSVSISGKEHQFNALDLTKFIFSEIRKRTESSIEGLARHLEEGGEVDVCISLPVLDSDSTGQKFNNQRRRTLEAARHAFDCPEDPDHPAASESQYSISEILEPEAAAFHLVLLAQDQRLRTFNPDRPGELVTFSDKETIIVYDSGGGTTDIAVGTLKVSPGSIELEEIQSFSSKRHDGRPYGGTAVTDAILRNLWTDPEEGDRWMALAHDIEGDPERSIPHPETGQANDVWHQYFPGFWMQIEQAKIELSSGDRNIKVQGRQVEAMPFDDFILEDYGEGKDVAAQASSLKDIIDHFKDKGKVINRIFLVGGNSNLLCLQKQLKDMLSPVKIVVPQIADSKGTLLDFVPVGVCLKNVQPLVTVAFMIRIVFDSDKEVKDVVFPKGLIGARSYRRSAYPGTKISVWVDEVQGWNGPERLKNVVLPGFDESSPEQELIDYRFYIEEDRLILSYRQDTADYDDVIYYL
jgi:hypothetical protein